ncbi:MAG: 2-oxoacid:acceptor oxidoreductase subunit alpha, partial [Candidatus Bathyarchaeia archaeon]
MSQSQIPRGLDYLQGNEALVEGAIAAGCRFFAGYPITPSN